MRSLLLYCTLIWLGAFAAVSAGATNPETALIPYQATYVARYNGMPIEAQRSLAKTETGYQLRTEARNFLGRIDEQEDFRLDAQGNILVDSYRYERKILGIARDESLQVDHTAGKASYKGHKKERVIDLNGLYLGPITYQLQLRRDLLEKQNPLNYQVMIRGRVKKYPFENLGKEELETPAGTFATFKLQRVRDDSERETLIWVAPALNYLMVKLQQRESDGESYELALKSVSMTTQTEQATMERQP